MNYFDILLAKKLEDDRDPKVEGLSVSENGRYHEDGVVYDPVIVNVPQTPLSKLTVTENGTYTAPTGTAYNEVEVDVPLPENAYLLKDIPNTPTAIATFSDGSNLPMPKLEVGIEPVQEGSGDPSPENVRPISGWDEVNVTRCGKNLFDISIDKDTPYTNIYLDKPVGQTITVSAVNNSVTVSEPAWIIAYVKKDGTTTYIGDSSYGTPFPQTITATAENPIVRIQYRGITITSGSFDVQTELGNQATTYEPYNGQTYEIDLDGTRYGGKVDLVSGVMTVDRVEVDLGTLNWDKYTSSTKTYFRTSAQLPDAKKSDNPLTTHNLMCSNYKEDSWSHVIDGSGYDGNICIGWNNNAYIGIYDSRYVDVSVSDFKTAMNGVQLVYELATPLTIQLPTTVVKSLGGVNNVWGDCGDILDLSYLAKEE